MGFLHHLTDPSSHLVKISFALFPYPHPSENGSVPQRGFGVPLRLKQLKREMPAVSQQGSLPGGITLQSFPGHQHLPGPHLREAPRSATSNQSLKASLGHPNIARPLIPSFYNLSSNLVFLQANKQTKKKYFLQSHQLSQGTDKQDAFLIDHKVLHSEDTDHISLDSPQLPVISRVRDASESVVVCAPFTASDMSALL